MRGMLEAGSQQMRRAPQRFGAPLGDGRVPVRALLLVMLIACRSEAVRSLDVSGVHLESEDSGVPLNPFGGGEVGHSVYVAGDVTNHGTKDILFVHLDVDLFRQTADKKPA